ncbi:MAG: PspC domain-containing protein [Spirochaetales bacterium]|nr:PspC domain-containing protein [Spirochaetales bacterium]
MATRRLYRSRNGEILGVCKGIAEWRDYPVDTIRLIVVLIAIFTAIAPCLVIYFILGLILPVNPYEDDNYERGYRDGKKDGRRENGKSNRRGKTYYYNPEPEDYVNEQAKAESAEEAERRKKESDWDNRFTNS